MAEATMSSESQNMLEDFWPKVMENIRNIDIKEHFKTQELPLARIKKIMKLDEDVKMISAEAPVLFAKACEIFIAELSMRAWIHTEENKRRTLQKNDVSQAVAKCDQFDFLIDIVPRDEIKPAKREDNLQRASVMSDQVQYYFQMAQQGQQAATSQPQQIQIQTANGQIVTAQPIQLSQLTQAGTQLSHDGQSQIIHLQQQAQPDQQQQQIVHQIQLQQDSTQQSHQQQAQEISADPQGGTQVFKQVVTPSGDVIHMPIHLTQAQLQAIQSQMQGKQPGQPFVISTGAEQDTDQEQPQPLFQVPIVTSEGQQVLLHDSEQSHNIHIKGEQ